MHADGHPASPVPSSAPGMRRRAACESHRPWSRLRLPDQAAVPAGTPAQGPANVSLLTPCQLPGTLTIRYCHKCILNAM